MHGNILSIREAVEYSTCISNRLANGQDLTFVRAPRACAEMAGAQHIIGIPGKDSLLLKVIS
jgi:hypothetical protein